ncbi:hypothetical protein JCM19239_6811 [Vibrio variabilis]|uniref:Uncharacterized protein n=1 Tax=Vibrio variabilis TaxID=990271 RepID=A0ABQ0JN54_9VIBR|nr:hypothetical protein JCM19239_6811 [Vibrio variabilis]
MSNKELCQEMLKVHIKLHVFASCFNEEMARLKSLIDSMDNHLTGAKKRQKLIDPDRCNSVLTV